MKTKSKILLIGLNAKYSHTNLAIRYLRNSLLAENHNAKILEKTINEPYGDILRCLYEEDAYIYGFSCYIWNIDLVLDLGKDLKKLKPNAKIILGGPEVSFEAEKLLENNLFIDCVLCSEGEKNLPKIAQMLINEEPIEKIYFCNPIYGTKIKAPYLENEIKALNGRIIYFETSRGCPFHCSYCLSSTEKGVRYRDLEEVKDELLQMVNDGAMLIKFVDRSFNSNPERAYSLISFLATLNTKTKFHFEICASLLREKDFLLLENLPENRFQLEVGVQSTNQSTLNEINRTFPINELITKLDKLNKIKTLHIHCDLIAGLPHEDLETFKQSFDRVFTHCDVLQLGFLKVLKGSLMKENALKYDLIYMEKAPYEILSNRWLCFDELLLLKKVEEALERFHNSKAFINSIRFLMEKTPSSFSFFYELGLFLEKENALFSNVSRKNDYLHLYHFALQQDLDLKMFSEYLRLDFISNFRGEPPFPYPEYDNRFYSACKQFFSSNKNLHKYCDIHLFYFGQKSVLLFDRKSGNILDVSNNEEFRF